MKNTVLALFLSLIMTSNAWGHSFWVNAYESFAHPPGHALITMGFGHVVPLEDLLAGDFGNISIAEYSVYDPSGKKMQLPLPDTKRIMPEELTKTLTVEKGDLGIRKLQFSEDSPKGSYQTAVQSVPAFFTQYVDNKGKTKMAMQSLDKVKNVEQVIYSIQFMSFAKTIFNYHEWTDIKPLGHDLEITPLVDVSDLHVGDMLPVSVTFMGKPLSIVGTNIEYITATSNTFGGPDKFSLYSYLMDGKAQFRMPTAGQWLLNVNVARDVDKDPTLSDLKGKANKIWYSATLNVTVKP
jgi:uncharacterized GH25 family protein